MRRTYLAIVVAGTILTNHANALDLIEALSAAQAHDSQFASARATREANSEKSIQGRAALLPAVTATAGKTLTDGTLVAAGVSNNFNTNTYNYQLLLRQPLYNAASFDTYEQSKLQVVVGEIQFEQAKNDLALRVAQAYFDVLASQDAIAFIQSQKTAIAEQLASAKRNFEVGTATITDTHEAQARFDLTLAQEIAATNDLEVKRNALAQITGKLPAELSGLKPGIKLTPPEPSNPDKWVEGAETGNIGVIVQKLVADIAKLEISRNRAGHMPTLDAVASHTRAPFGTTNTITSNAIGLQLTVPIFSGYGTSSKIREAVSLESKARSDLDTVRRNAAQTARTAYLGLQSGLSQVRALEAAEVSSNSALESNRLGYEVGVRINIDVLNAQQQLYSTRCDLAKARYDALVNGLKLKAATGALVDSDISQLNSLLDTR